MKTDSSNFKVTEKTIENIQTIILGELKIAYLDGALDALKEKIQTPEDAVQQRFYKCACIIDKLLGGEIEQ